MWSTPSSTARRSTAIAASWSRGGPKTPGPGSCIAPKPMRWTDDVPRGKVSMPTNVAEAWKGDARDGHAGRPAAARATSARRCAPSSTTTGRPCAMKCEGLGDDELRSRSMPAVDADPARAGAAPGRGGAHLVPPGDRRRGRRHGVVRGRERLPDGVRRDGRDAAPRRSRRGRPRSSTPAASSARPSRSTSPATRPAGTRTSRCGW